MVVMRHLGPKIGEALAEIEIGMEQEALRGNGADAVEPGLDGRGLA